MTDADCTGSLIVTDCTGSLIVTDCTISFTPCSMRFDNSIIRSDGMLPREALDLVSRGDNPVEANGFLGINSSLLLDLSRQCPQTRRQRGRTDLAQRSDSLDLLHHLLLCGVKTVLVSRTTRRIPVLWNGPPTPPPYPCECGPQWCHIATVQAAVPFLLLANTENC